MTADLLPGFIHHISGPGRKKFHQKLFEITLAYKTDPCGIFFTCYGKPFFPAQSPNILFLQFANGKEHFFHLSTGEPCQKIRLILACIQGTQKPRPPRRLVQTGIMTGGHIICTGRKSKLQKSTELDLTVAQYIGVGRTAAAIFLQKIRKYSLPIFFGKVHGIIGDVQLLANLADILIILFCGARTVLFLPVFHKHGGDIVPLPLQKHSGSGAVYSA